ncbi:transglycosylase domain-containing protein, partial [Paracoccus sp. FO-3]
MRTRRLALFLMNCVLVLGIGAGLRDRFDDWVDATALPRLDVPVGVEVVARDGSLLRAFQVADGRWRLDAGPVDPLFLDMLMTWEDRRFAGHAGIDGRALLRAGWQALRHGRVVSGGSTLTMQVARLIEEGPTGQWAGKARQIRLALALERRLEKREILALYLRLAPYGANVEGIRAASLQWFGKEPRRLTPAQAALLVALPQSPEARRPDRFPEAARAARDRVLARAVRAGLIS